MIKPGRYHLATKSFLSFIKNQKRSSINQTKTYFLPISRQNMREKGLFKLKLFFHRFYVKILDKKSINETKVFFSPISRQNMRQKSINQTKTYFFTDFMSKYETKKYCQN